jgi:hypothetical protein
MAVMRSMHADNDIFEKEQLIDYWMEYTIKISPELLVNRIDEGLIMVLGQWR